MGQIHKLIKLEEERQRDTLMMIPSENYASEAVREALGSVLGNKYSEGYPDRRYYQGNKIIDQIEELAIKKAKKLFGVPHANVQPYSGSPANSEVFFALLSPGDCVLGMKLDAGGHLTHGQPNITFSGKYFKSVQFGLDANGLIDYSQVKTQALLAKPKLMIIGTTAYPRILDWKKFGQIADSVGAYLVADISHVAGLIVGGVYPSPVKYAHIVTTTTHKTLRGPRGAMIMVTQKGLKKDPKLGQKIDRAVFPGMQGGPHNNVTAAIAQCLIEADTPEFAQYAKQVVANAKTLAKVLGAGPTESHMVLLDLKPRGLNGATVAEALEIAGIVVNKNALQGDTSVLHPSGIRLGTPALTSRGMKEREMEKIGEWILQVINHVDDKTFLLGLAQEVKKLCARFPIP